MAHGQFQEAPNPEELNRLLEKLDSIPNLPPLAETQLLRALIAYAPASAWGQPIHMQLAQRLREQSEQLAVPASLGIHYWTRPLIDAGDFERRRGEDHLFVGGEESSGQSANLFQAAQEQFGLAEDTNRIVHQALDVRNQAAAELPWLAQWIATPQPIGAPVAAEESEVIETLLTLIEEFHQLSRMLDQIEIHELGNANHNPVSVASLKKQSQLVEEGFTRLQTRFDKRYADLLFAKSKDADTLRAIEALLAVPILPRGLDELGRNPSQQRDALFQKRRENAAASHEEFFSDAAELSNEEAPPSSQESEGLVTTELDRLVARWKRHPALAFVMDAPPNPKDLELAAKDLPRKTIARMGAKAQEAFAHDSGSNGGAAQCPHRYGDGLSNATERIRPASRGAACFGFPALDDNPIVQLRMFDLQQLLVWNAHRHLEDFWGLPVDNSTRFYEAATADCLQNAGFVFDGNPLWDRQLRDLNRLLDQRKQASQAGLITRAANSIRIYPDDDVSTSVVVAPGPEAAANSLPAGYASVFIQKSGTALLTERYAVKLPRQNGADGAETFPFLIPGSPMGSDLESSTLRATALFRGHQFAEPFQLLAMAGTQVSVIPQSYDTAQITVKTFLNRRSSIVFILDSSATMNDPIPRENTEGSVRKLDAARSALKSMLEEIALLPRTHVGVFFYGHRVGNRPDAVGILERQEAYKLKYPFEEAIKPYEDVERVLELGRFSSVFAGQLEERMDVLKPWGETPLYLAITEAIAEFEDDDPDSEKHIVVVTDGLNYQFNPSQAANKAVSDVLASVRGKRIRIHIVGLGISEQDAATAQREFGQIARATEGKYVAVDRASRLIDSIKTVLEPREYAVTSEDGETREAKVRQSITVPADPFRPREYRVELGTLETMVPVEGGEAIELVVSSAEDKLECVRYEDNSPRFVPLIVGTPARSSGYELGIHQAKFFPNGVRFEVSLQNVNRLVPPRPQEIWMEVVPKSGSVTGNLTGGGKTYPRYVFYDAQFTPDCPVPVLTWVAEDWPAEAPFAEIRFWCNFRSTEPGEVVAWEDIANRPFAQRVDVPIPGVPGITWQLSQRGNRVGIVERHSVNSPGINALKVDLFSRAKPVRIVRRFDEKAGLVSHSFEFQPADVEQFGVGDKPQIRFTTRTEIHADSYRLDEAVLIEIGEASDVIQPHPVLMAP